MASKARPPRPPDPPSRSEARAQLTPGEAWYFECWTLLAGHLGRAPSIAELAKYCERTETPTYIALIRIEAKGYLLRNVETGRFEAVA